LGRRVRAVERKNQSVLSDRKYVWAIRQLVEERDATGVNPTKRYFDYGVQTVAYNPNPTPSNFYYARDHLGSIREVTDGVGAIRARYDYDPFGRRFKVSGDLDSDLGYTGHMFHARSGLLLTQGRPYDADLGRWLSRDPIEEKGGLNLFAYVFNNPVNFYDPKGENAVTTVGGIILGDLVIPDPTDLAAPIKIIGYGILLIGAIIIVAATSTTACKVCPPCPPAPAPEPPRIDIVPPSRPHFPCPGNHMHIYSMETNQTPYPDCKCFYKQTEQVICL
jgi:RHS repeat-associated protein